MFLNFPPEIVFFSMLGVPAGIVILYLGLRWFRQKQLIENIPTSKIRSLAMGLAEIYGSVTRDGERLLQSPFSGDDCVYYRFTIEEFRKDNKGGVMPTIVIGENPGGFSGGAGGGSWYTIKHGEDRTHFFLKDATGQVFVDPAGAKIDLKPDYEFTSGMGADPPQRVLSFLEGQGISHEGFFGMNKQMRFREYVVRPGDNLFILGTAGDNPFVEEGSAKANAEDIMIHKGENEKFYLISDSSERDLLSGLGWKSMAGIFGGIALVAVSMAVVLSSFGFF
jgi:hypothetical protein